MTQTEETKSPQYIIEGIILRRMHEKRIEGYTLEMSKEIAAALAALPRSAASSVEAVSIDLMQRVWFNLYFDEEEAGNTFQQTLNEVVDWLAAHNSLPDAAPTTSPEPFDLAAFQKEAETWETVESEVQDCYPAHAFDQAAVTSPEPDSVREALVQARAELKVHDEDYQHRTEARVFQEIDAALAALSRPAHGDVKAFQELACEKLQDMRAGWACDFKTPENQGQRGHDRTNALYEAIMLVKGLPISRNDRVTSQPDTDGASK